MADISERIIHGEEDSDVVGPRHRLELADGGIEHDQIGGRLGIIGVQRFGEFFVELLFDQALDLILGNHTHFDGFQIDDVGEGVFFDRGFILLALMPNSMENLEGGPASLPFPSFPSSSLGLAKWRPCWRD